MPALVAVMIMVSIGTFSWNSIPNLRRHPWPSSVVMLTTVVVVVGTHDLSLGVLAGVLLSGIFFAGKVQRMFGVERTLSDDGQTAHLPHLRPDLLRFSRSLRKCFGRAGNGAEHR